MRRLLLLVIAALAVVVMLLIVGQQVPVGDTRIGGTPAAAGQWEGEGIYLVDGVWIGTERACPSHDAKCNAIVALALTVSRQLTVPLRSQWSWRKSQRSSGSRGMIHIRSRRLRGSLSTPPSCWSRMTGRAR